MENEILVCSNCGSEKLEMKCWVNINTNDVLECATFDETDYWCPDCETHQLPIDKSKWNK